VGTEPFSRKNESEETNSDTYSSMPFVYSVSTTAAGVAAFE
jgi:hypothetical protein